MRAQRREVGEEYGQPLSDKTQRRTFHDRLLPSVLFWRPPQRAANSRRHRPASSAAAQNARQTDAALAVRSSAERKDSTRRSTSLGRAPIGDASVGSR